MAFQLAPCLSNRDTKIGVFFLNFPSVLLCNPSHLCVWHHHIFGRMSSVLCILYCRSTTQVSLHMLSCQCRLPLLALPTKTGGNKGGRDETPKFTDGDRVQKMGRGKVKCLLLNLCSILYKLCEIRASHLKLYGLVSPSVKWRII